MNRSHDTFRDIHITEKNGQIHYCYRTALTVYEEVFTGSRYLTAGWNTAGYTLNVLEDFPTWLGHGSLTEPQAFDIEVDGVSLSWDWKNASFASFEETLENGTPVTHGVVTLENRLKPVCVKVHTILDGTAVFTRYIEVENIGTAPLNLNVLAPISGGVEALSSWKDHMNGIPDPTKIYSLGYMNNAEWGHEGLFKWHDLPSDTFAIDGRYLSPRHRHPMFVLRNNLTGTILTAQMGWAGGYRFAFTLNTNLRNATACELAFRMEMQSQKPILILAPGETFESPHIHIGMMRGDLDEAVNAMHRHLRRSVFTLPAARGVKGWIEGGMGPERLMDVTATKHFADTMAEVGAETLIIDAGWYCPPGTATKEWHPRAGDWYPHPDLYPNGIEEIRDYIHEKGLLFGLWLDLERLGKVSAAAKEHPEWISRCYINGYENSQLNMAIPEAAAWAESELSRVIETYKIDLFRLDYNLGTFQLHCRYAGENGVENAFARYYQNTNAMYRRLREKYPDVVFENCAGGGGRTDVAFLSNFTHSWVSDHNTAPRSFAITNGMTMALPPEYVDRLASGMNCHTMGDLRFQLRNIIFGRPTTNDYNTVGSKMNPLQIEIARHTLDIYKKHIRPYIDESLIFHHTPELTNDPACHTAVTEQPRGTGILERASEDGQHSVIGIFHLANQFEEQTYRIRPRGVDPSLRYRVTMDNTGASVEMSGLSLVTEGIPVRISGALNSELLILEAI